MASYVVYHYNITDRSRIDELQKQSIPVNEKFGAKVIVGSPIKPLVGNTYSHMVILEFADFTTAQTFYDSDEHKELSILMREVTEGWSAVVPGDSETQGIVDSGYFASH